MFRLGRVVPLVICLIVGAVFALVFSRGPQDGPGAVASVLGGLAVGSLAGRLARGSRWYLPLAAAFTCEVTRSAMGMGLSLEQVRGLFTGSQYSLATLLFGRGVDLLLGLLPLTLGLALFTGRARKRRQERADAGTASAWRVSRPAGVLAVLMAVTSLGTLLPASTPPIAGGIAEEVSVRIGGCGQRMVIRGASASNPVIFFLSGGPGGTEIGTIRNQWTQIERNFTVVVWDQTGAGANGRCFPADGRLTMGRVVDDALAALEYVNKRFGKRPILVGNSWGTILGVILIQRRPDLVSAYVGTGQMISLLGTDKVFYETTIAWARSHGRPEVAERLTAQGPPPYASMYPYEELFAHEGDWNPWDRDPAISAAVNPLANVLDKPELDAVAKLRYVQNLIETFSVLYPQVQGIDFRRDVPELKVPVYIANGVHEAPGRAMFVRPWFDALKAPRKVWTDFANSGHKPFGEEPGAFLALLRRVASP